ncbi:MAG: hypothetical protein JOY98_06005 [Candidatus Eremiobacteraeota bacterium]|nr:hypothetical protein [Candidatus Eremiobacteraeota bacterium]
MSWIDPKTRYAAIVLVIALLASFTVAVLRARAESHAKRVELAMDFQDFDALARSYNYNPAAFLIALRRAGLTSLALTEELGGNVGYDGKAYAVTGAQLLNQARVSAIADPLLARLLAAKRVDPGAVYLLISDPASYHRYRTQLALHFMPKTVRVLRAKRPWLLEVHTQIDYFNNTALGIPTDQLRLARYLGLLVIPRFQNDERFQEPQMNALFDDVLGYDPKVSTVIFFGLRNQVLGYPDHIDDAAAAFKKHAFSFGAIETYDDSQVQKGNVTLARLIPGRTVRVQAIAKTELDKLRLDEVVARYVLGVRERNVRVVYLRPWDHQDGNLSIEATNVEMIKAIADELKSDGYKLGRATPILPYRGNNRLLVGLAALAVPSIFVLLLGFFGWYRHAWAIAAYALTIALYGGAVVAHHDMIARSVIALAGALLFATAAFLALIPAFVEAPAPNARDQVLRSLGWTVLATAVALLGALVVVGLMSSPLAMEEIERFRGVKAVLAVPPLVALLLYLFDKRYGSGVERPRDVFLSPVLTYQLFLGIVLVAGGVLLVMRSGNDSDVSPSQIELSLRHVLTHVLSVRPRFKEFLIGFPCIMLIPALIAAHRRAAGWLLALGAGVGIGDVIDTFSHLHTPLSVSILRVFNGLWVGALVGIVAILVYRRVAGMRSSTTAG